MMHLLLLRLPKTRNKTLTEIQQPRYQLVALLLVYVVAFTINRLEPTLPATTLKHANNVLASGSPFGDGMKTSWTTP